MWQIIRFLLTVYLVAETGELGGHILTQNLIAVAHKPHLLCENSHGPDARYGGQLE
jgi:hypothetical protein